MAGQGDQICAVVVDAVELRDEYVLDPHGIAEQQHQGMKELLTHHRRKTGRDLSNGLVESSLRGAAEIHAFANL